MVTLEEGGPNAPLCRVARRRPRELRKKLRRSQRKDQIARIDPLGIGCIDRVFRAHRYVVELAADNAKGTLSHPNLRNNQVARQRLEERSLVTPFFRVTAKEQFTAESYFGDDVEALKRAGFLVDGGDAARQDIAERGGLENISSPLGPRTFDPYSERPPPPDQAAEGRGKSGMASGSAPASVHAVKARQASRTAGRSFGTPSPVSPVEVMPTAAGAATKTG